MQTLETIHRMLDELAISLGNRDVVLHMLSYNREVVENYRQVIEQLQQQQQQTTQSPNGKVKAEAKKP